MSSIVERSELALRNSQVATYSSQSGIDWGKAALYGAGAVALIGVTSWIGYHFDEIDVDVHISLRRNQRS